MNNKSKIEDLPFFVTQNSKEMQREQAVLRLMMELQKGEASVDTPQSWVAEEDIQSLNKKIMSVASK